MALQPTIYSPCNRLKPYIKHFILTENVEASIYKVIPGTSLVMGFQYSGRLAYMKQDQQIALSTAGITGLMPAYRTFSSSPNIRTVLVVFEETGAAHFLQTPLNELFNESLSLDHFFNRSQLTAAQDKLNDDISDDERMRIIEQLLINHLKDSAEDMLVTRAVRLMHQSRGTIRIAELAAQLHISQSPLEKRFRKIVGASPKKFSSIVRLKNIMNTVNAHNYQEVTYIAGYYDQAHMIKDFKVFTGLTPEQYVKTLKA